MIRTRFAAIFAASAIAFGAVAVAAPAQAAPASYPFQNVSYRFLDVGPDVYTILVQTEGSATQKVNLGGVTKTVKRDWQISLLDASSKAGDQYDADGNLIAPDYATLPTVHVGYWVARYAADQFGKAEDRFYASSNADVEAFYQSVVSTSPSKAAAYFKASDVKAAHIAVVKSDVQRNSNKAFAYVASLIDKHGSAEYIHAHKSAITNYLNAKFTKSKAYKGSVKVKFTQDFVVQMGPTKADRDRELHYVVTVHDNTDKVAYAIDMNTHDGGAYGVHSVKY